VEVASKGIPITKRMVWESYKKVKSNKGSGGVDRISLTNYSENLSKNLYKLWNRLTSGSYYPQAVLEVEIPKKDGSKRKLGIPSIEDRIAQQVIKDYLEPSLEREFHESSYGYRPSRNAHQALEEVRYNVRQKAWVIDMDIKSFFDRVSHELLGRALTRHVEEDWVKLYIDRWLNCPKQVGGEVVYKEVGEGTPQGGVISPLLSNLFLHYAFDRWMDKTHPGIKFVRYADDVIVHCASKSEAEQILMSIKSRLKSCQLDLHEKKTKIVFCKSGRRKSSHRQVSFNFLGYGFQPRTSATKAGKLFLGFDCAISKESQTKIAKELRSTNFQRWTGRSIEEIAEFFNSKLRGWLNYFGKFRRWKLNRIFKLFNARLTNWVRNRYKRLNKSYIKACKWLREYKTKNPELFVHWKYGFIDS
jgi:group II intron reverse transcriptase/maturase